MLLTLANIAEKDLQACLMKHFNEIAKAKREREKAIQGEAGITKPKTIKNTQMQNQAKGLSIRFTCL